MVINNVCLAMYSVVNYYVLLFARCFCIHSFKTRSVFDFPLCDFLFHILISEITKRLKFLLR